MGLYTSILACEAACITSSILLVKSYGFYVWTDLKVTLTFKMYGSISRQKHGVDVSQDSVHPVLHLSGHPSDVQIIS